jgi:dTDP-L-rhamnose 4-epimerase
VDVVFHLAAYHSYSPDFSEFFYTNCYSTALMYEVIVEERYKIEKIIVSSSQAVYGEGKYRCPKCNRIKYPDIRIETDLSAGDWEIHCEECGYPLQAMWTNENRVNPQNQYAISKYSQEITSLTLGKRYHIPTCCLRYSVVQGPRQSIYSPYTGICRIFCICHFFDRQPIIYEDGSQLRDFVNIHDVIEANLIILESPQSDFRVFNIGGGKAYSVLEFSQIVGNIFDKKITPIISNEFRFGDTRHIFSDISRMRELGWKPQFTPKESVEEYVRWLEKIENKDNLFDDAMETMKKLNIIRKIKDDNSNQKKKNYWNASRSKKTVRYAV